MTLDEYYKIKAFSRQPLEEPYGDIVIVEEKHGEVCRLQLDDAPVEDYNHRQSMRANLIAQAPVILADLKLAAETLRRYEAAHRAKNTEESTAKAEVNASLASRFEETIRKTGC